ncbi:MAG: Cna B-type domain-containing protein [Arcanobacterium sp.]
MNTTHYRVSRVFTGIIAVLGLVLALLVPPAAATPALRSAQPQAPSFAAQNVSNRVEVNCFSLEDEARACHEEALRQIIANAGTEPTRIVLGKGDTMLTYPLVIPNGADIEFVNYPAEPEADSESILAREQGMFDVMIRVEEGAKLTFDTNVTGGMLVADSRGEQVPASTPIIEVQGEFVMNDGVIVGMRNGSGNFMGAVTVRGPNAFFLMNGGSIIDNQRAIDDPHNIAEFGAASVALDEKATMIMNGGTIGGGAAGSESVGETGGIGVYNGSYFEMNGGEITWNSGWAGAINAFSWETDIPTLAAQSEVLRSTVVINEGGISYNTGTSGGAVTIYGNAEVVMNGGSIWQNEAVTGGGVSAMDLYVMSLPEFGGEIPADGMEAGYNAEDWSQISPAAFTMNGGFIGDNFAQDTGGGIYVASNAVNIVAGDIAGNRSGLAGGGISVASQSYRLNLSNVVLEGNSSSLHGGGVWLSATGSLNIYDLQGGAIFNNSARLFGDDIAHSGGVSGGYVPALDSHLSQVMLGEGTAAYYRDGGVGDETRFDPVNPGSEQVIQNVAPENQDPSKEYFTAIENRGLYQVSTVHDQDSARALAELRIIGNSSQWGGGIAANGVVTIGAEAPVHPELTSLTVDKVWLDYWGQPITRGLPDEIYLQPVRLEGEERIPVGDPVAVGPDMEGDWRHTFTGLPKYDAGELIQYSVAEDPVMDYHSDIGVATLTDDGYQLSVVNMRMDPELMDIVVVKQWIDHEGSPLSYGETWPEYMGMPMPSSVDVQLLSIEGDGPVTPVGSGTLTPGEDGSWQYEFHDLRRYNGDVPIIYWVDEAPIEGYTSEVGDPVLTDFGAVITVINTRIQPELTSLTVDKVWVDHEGAPLADGLPESIELQLVRYDGVSELPVGEPVTVTPDADGNWSYTFENLLKYAGDTEATYSVVETEIADYTSTVSEPITTASGSQVTVTNTRHAPEPLTGEWVAQDGKWWYRYSDGTWPSAGLVDIEGTTYAFDDAGYVVNGWYQDADGTWYYSTNYGIKTGWLSSAGKWYYFDSTGAMVTGWLSTGGSWYYFSSSGAMVTGWLSTGGNWYYFNSSGAMVTGWLSSGGSWYYFSSSGAMVTGWLSTGGSWYYFSSSGAMVTGWLSTGGNWYYFNSSGTMATGWLLIGGTWYYFNSSGVWVS